jgi:cytochrome c oxidase assembly protein subunit 15
METPSSYPGIVKYWLLTGVFLVFMQVVIGGITRLTGSGLSITKWEIVTGTFPPVTAAQWEEAFELYKTTPQYHQINKGMSIGEFKFIFFWEYFHRLWARMMGFVFLIPFLIFWRKGWIDKLLMRRLGVVVLLAALAASFGWIMVASGLVNRPWVNAYKLTLHLGIALAVFGYLWWTAIGVWQPKRAALTESSAGTASLASSASSASSVPRSWGAAVFFLVIVQILLGGVMSGMKAGLSYPTWPDMHGAFIPSILTDFTQWNVDNFVEYDKTPFMPALVQVLHRNTAYVLTIIILWFSFLTIKTTKSKQIRLGIIMLITLLITLVLLGIFTLINSIGVIPVGLGVFHQAVAILLLAVVIYLRYQIANLLPNRIPLQ